MDIKKICIPKLYIHERSRIPVYILSSIKGINYYLLLSVVSDRMTCKIATYPSLKRALYLSSCHFRTAFDPVYVAIIMAIHQLLPFEIVK